MIQGLEFRVYLRVYSRISAGSSTCRGGGGGGGGYLRDYGCISAGFQHLQSSGFQG